MKERIKIYFCDKCGHRDYVKPEDKIVIVTCSICLEVMEEIKNAGST